MEETFSLEEKITEIREIVDKMQKGISDFDEQIRLFKKGNVLISDCQTYLDEAEMQVKQLIDGKLTDME